jgi:hypothetical protein
MIMPFGSNLVFAVTVSLICKILQASPGPQSLRPEVLQRNAESMYNLQDLLQLQRERRFISFYPGIIMNMDLNSKGMSSRPRYAFT